MFVLIFIMLFVNINLNVYANDKLDIYYFYENPCASCNSEDEFIDLFNNLVGDIKAKANYNLIIINTFQSGNKKLDEVCNNLNIESRNLPILIISDKALLGETEINNKMRQTFCEVFNIEYTEINLPESEENAQIYTDDEQNKNFDIKIGTPYLRYYYTVSCDDCKKVKALLDEVQNKYPLVVIERLNISEQDYIVQIQQLFDKFKVPEKQRQVPIIFYQNGWASGYDEIKSNIDDIIKNDIYYNGFLDFETDIKLNNYNLFFIGLAGFLNGLNPCGISMLLLVISILITYKKHIISLGFIYIITKGIVYLAIALGLYSAISILEGNIFNNISQIVKIIASIIMIIIALINLIDYIHCKQGEYGKIHLQLPNNLRKFNHSIIEYLKNPKFQKYIFLCIIIISIIVSAGEFLCTGQIMLATLIYMVQASNTINILSLIALIIYIICMLIPLTILILLVNKGTKLFSLSETVRTNMHFIKLANAIIFIIFSIIILIL